ncbi:type II toxin-antitoxin system HicA family toxin [Methanoculleus horonobensis]|jgi:predicted RNA binding protein YcfA (HicA-like mRNA interferase family)|nr:type II toxin-antitoxin system HicA family toxin [Methanoculleus horonobensis]
MKLPRTTGAKVVSALRKAGFEEVGTRGSHHYLYHA